MKLLLKLLGISDYIEELEHKLKVKDQQYTNLQEVLNLAQLEKDGLKKELNTVLASKTELTAKVLELQEQIKTLKQLNKIETEVNFDLTKRLTTTEETLKLIKHTSKHRLLQFLKDDLNITITNEDIYEYDD